MGVPVSVDPLSMVTARGAIAGLTRRGDISCGGATRLLRTVDGWIALALARDDDLALVPALVEQEVGNDPWHTVERWCVVLHSADVVVRGIMLGLPIAALPPEQEGSGELAVPVRHVHGTPTAPKRARDLVVVDLSSLWAGPLCGDLLARAGCTVVKVESLTRPDGTRFGPDAFFDLLNANKRSVALDFRSAEGVAALHRLVGGADVVIDASRPRALAQLGLDVDRLLATGPRVWVSITGHGCTGEDGNRIAFGDDAAVAGGLVVHDESGPSFCADAVADPIAGITAAAAALECVGRDGRWHLDVGMAQLAAHLSGETLAVPSGVVATASKPPPAGSARAPAFGADTAWALART